MDGCVRAAGENEVNVLVTGGAGYIGSHTRKALAATELGFRAEASSLKSIISTAWTWATRPPAYAA